MSYHQHQQICIQSKIIGLSLVHTELRRRAMGDIVDY